MQGLRQKFKQNQNLLKYLKNTQQLKLGEASRDPKWGIGLSLDDPDVLDDTKWTSTGNLLGRSLTKIRQEFLKPTPTSPTRQNANNKTQGEGRPTSEGLPTSEGNRNNSAPNTSRPQEVQNKEQGGKRSTSEGKSEETETVKDATTQKKPMTKDSAVDGKTEEAKNGKDDTIPKKPKDTQPQKGQGQRASNHPKDNKQKKTQGATVEKPPSEGSSSSREKNLPPNNNQQRNPTDKRTTAEKPREKATSQPNASKERRK